MSYIYFQPHRSNVKYNSCFVECICLLKGWSFVKAERKIRKIIPDSLYFKSPTKYGVHDDDIVIVLDKLFKTKQHVVDNDNIKMRDLKLSGTYVIACHSEDEKDYHITVHKDGILYDHSPKILSFIVDYIYEIEEYK